jgi:hypothetical protein
MVLQPGGNLSLYYLTVFSRFVYMLNKPDPHTSNSVILLHVREVYLHPRDRPTDVQNRSVNILWDSNSLCEKRKDFLRGTAFVCRVLKRLNALPLFGEI